MRLYSFDVDGQTRLGAERDGRLVVLGGLLAAHNLPDTLPGLLRQSPDALRLVGELLDSPAVESGETVALDQVRLRPPLARPGKILCAGVNFKSHLDENPGARLPSEPFFFSKLPSCVIGPGDPILYNPRTKQLDWEVELAAIIGRPARRLTRANALDCVAGYTILNDVSARDVQFKDFQITLGKNFDTFAPLGPCLVTPDELPNLDRLRLRSSVNGRGMQDGSMADIIFDLPALLAHLTEVMTLEPGDVVSAGTPSGVGVFRQPPRFLQPGDTVSLEVEGIGTLTNPVVADG